ncbi:MAG: class I SAM-dependent rRNA methyltransferase [Candidatus Hydrogenedentota bacterium]|nr:MAG: class I SAM-dependent rRNA methyltransferase [Candidatus Hydrogenedentota bacterium]
MREHVRTVKLKKNEDRRIRAGHLWIFSNEIANLDQRFAPGEIVDIATHAGGFVGRGYINPQSLISVRVLTRNKEAIDQKFFKKRIARALALRRRVLPEEQSYRVVFGEADGLPGLIIDKYADVLVLQVSTLGMQMRLGEILGALPAVGLSSRALVLRADTPMAELEGFSGESRVLGGDLELPVRIEQDGLFFDVDVLEGQKTGFYLDQRENRRCVSGLFRGLRVLDCFCYTGAWSLYAGKAGAKQVLGIDTSTHAIEIARRNTNLNSLGSTCRFERADAFEKLNELVQRGEKMDCVILDPPALVKSKRHLKQGEAAYERVNRLAMKLVVSEGLLISCSCSFHISCERFSQILSASARKSRRSALLIEWRGQARDHPTLLAMPETAYLKCAVMRIA